MACAEEAGSGAEMWPVAEEAGSGAEGAGLVLRRQGLLLRGRGLVLRGGAWCPLVQLHVWEENQQPPVQLTPGPQRLINRSRREPTKLPANSDRLDDSVISCRENGASVLISHRLGCHLCCLFQVNTDGFSIIYL